MGLLQDNYIMTIIKKHVVFGKFYIKVFQIRHGFYINDGLSYIYMHNNRQNQHKRDCIWGNQINS